MSNRKLEYRYRMADDGWYEVTNSKREVIARCPHIKAAVEVVLALNKIL